ncbi:MAG: hypothetical protein ACI97K_000244 [Glaciecola sp.]|jgi:hypothetical protein
MLIEFQRENIPDMRILDPYIRISDTTNFVVTIKKPTKTI